jgi:pSer/pThr/pTyr-binding forkhead associated (FHA) protein
MSVRLTSTSGVSLDRRLTADDLPAMIGRSDEAEIFIGDRWASRHHCKLVAIGERLKVIDLSSRHGTFVNQQRIDEAWLEPGDELSIGMTTLVVEGSLNADTPSEPRWQFQAV